MYDSGDYAAALDRVLDAAGYPGLRDEQAKRRAAGEPVQMGIGLACYVEIAGAGSEAGEDMHADRAFRQHLARVLTRRALEHRRG